jgi:UDP-N-acetyl-D-glucosamine dehydrogenase
MAIKNTLLKIKNKKVKVGIIGMGYVGLPLAKSFVEKNIDTYGFDIDQKKITNLRKNISYINYFAHKEIKKMNKKKFTPTADFSLISKMDLIILCLPTPIKKNKSPDMSYILSSLKTILPFLKENQVLSLESTTYPGTCEEVILPLLNKKFNVGKNFYLVYSPEREDPGNKKYSLLKIPKVLGGLTKNCKLLGEKFYSLLGIKLIIVNDLKTAEFTKLLENIYRSVNIGLINEMKNICSKMGINIFNAIEAAGTKPFGFQKFYPGPGYGGHCIPIDPFLLAWKAKKSGADAKFIRLSGTINERMPIKISKKIISYCQRKNEKNILIIGMAYKKNVDDLRESPSLRIMDILEKNNLKINYHDPYIKELPKTRKFKIRKKSITLTKKILNKCIVLIVTDHDNIDYNFIKKNSKYIFDCRGRYKKDYKGKIVQV